MIIFWIKYQNPFNPLSPSSDKCQISPRHMIESVLYIQIVRIKKMITEDKSLDV